MAARGGSGNPPPLSVFFPAVLPLASPIHPSRNELRREAALRPGSAGAKRIGADTRATAVSWMVEVAAGVALQQETLFAAVSHMDRFLAQTEVSEGGGGGRLRNRALFLLSAARTYGAPPSRPPPPSRRQIVPPTKMLQLLALACVSLAAKQEEVRRPGGPGRW